jgi:hypothetical protein
LANSSLERESEGQGLGALISFDQAFCSVFPKELCATHPRFARQGGAKGKLLLIDAVSLFMASTRPPAGF